MNPSNWLPILDQQLEVSTDRLQRDVRLTASQSPRVATSVAAEVSGLDALARARIQSSDPIPVRQRLDELVAFQRFMDLVSGMPSDPAVIRAQVIVQNYVCFVYLGDSCFKALKRELPSSTVTGRCCRFLLNNPVRAFRNAVAHANWSYTSDFTGIRFFARKGEGADEPLAEFSVVQQELSFWQALARATAYAAFQQL